MTNPRPNPYVGPRSFETGEHLYGRAREQRMLSAQLISERVVLLHSPSGAGKTSLIRAGLIPLMQEENFYVLPIVRVNLEPDASLAGLPGFNRYIYSVIASLEEGLPPDQRRPLDGLATLSLDSYLAQRPRPANAPRSDLLVFDQFEEILTVAPTDREGKLAFFTQLGVALRNSQRWWLFAMREDYLGAVYPYARPLPNRFEVTFRLDLLGPDAALQAVQAPARQAGLVFKDEAARQLVDDLRSVLVQLPDGTVESVLGEHIEPVQLQVVCYRLWESLSADDICIDLDDLATVGDVDQSLADYYAASVSGVAAQAGLSERSLREWFETRLITKEGIRGQVLMGAQTSEGLDNRAVRLLENAHIIRGEKRAGATWFELSHDRLIQPVRKNNAAWFEANLTVFQRQTALWVSQGHTESLLLRGKALQQAETEAKGIPLTSEETAFFKACRKLHAQEQLRRRLVAGLVALLAFSLLTLVLSLLAYRQSAARALVTVGRSLLNQDNPRQAVMYAVQAQQIAPVPEALDLLGDATGKIDRFGDRALLGHLAPILSVTWLPDGRLASISQDGDIIFWDLDTGKPARVINTRSQNGLAIQYVAWSADGRLAIGDLSGSIAIWDLDSGRQLITLKDPEHYIFNTAIAWAADGRLVSSLTDGKIILWDLDSGTPAQVFDGGSFIYHLAWSMEGQLASSSVDGITIWDTVTGRRLQTLELDFEIVAWSPDGRLASSNNDSTITIWDLASGKPVQVLKGHDGSVISIAWRQDGTLASGDSDQKVILWDLNTGQPERIFNGHTSFVTSLAWSPDGQLATGSVDNTIILWDLAETDPGKKLVKITNNGTYYSLSLGGQVAYVARDGTITVYDLENGQPPKVFTGHVGMISSLGWSPDGQLASGYSDGTVVIWDSRKGIPAQTFHEHSGGVRSIAWSPDGRLASGDEKGKVILWNLHTSKPSRILDSIGWIEGIYWSSDGWIAAKSNSDVLIWDLTKSKPGTKVRMNEYIDSVSWLSDGWLALETKTGEISIWDTKNKIKMLIGQPDHVLKENKNLSPSLSWSTDGGLASIDGDENVRIWDLSTGKPIHVQNIKNGRSVTWMAQGKLAVLTNDGVLVLHPALTKPACDLVLRDLTIPEWDTSVGRLLAYRPACEQKPADRVPFPTRREWWDFVTGSKMIDYDESTFSNMAYAVSRFIWFTWGGRLLVLSVILLFGALAYSFLRLAQTRSIGWVLALVGIDVGYFVIMSIIAANSSYQKYFDFASLPFSLLLTLAFTGLFLRYISKKAHWKKILLSASYLAGSVYWLGIDINNLMNGSNGVPINFEGILLIFWGTPTLALILWQLCRFGRWVYHKLRRPKPISSLP